VVDTLQVTETRFQYHTANAISFNDPGDYETHYTAFRR